jgi:2-aminoadipate transaminase
MRKSKIVAPELNIPEGIIDLGVGQPSMDLLPLALLAQAAEHRLQQDQPQILAYGLGQGNGYFREALAGFLTENYRFDVNPDHLFVTAGASQGLDFICRLFTLPGDTIFVEEPSYSLALRIFRDRRLNIIGIPMDEDGLQIEALKEALKNHSPVFLYTIPTFHNPTGRTLSESRKNRLVEMCAEHDFFIVADEVYQLLDYTDSRPTPLAKFTDSKNVLSLGSFSKILAPGLRLGWIQTHSKWIRNLVANGLIDSGGGLNPFTSAIVQSAIELGMLEKQVGDLKTKYKTRMAALNSALEENLDESVTFHNSGGGFFSWLRLPDGVDTEDLLENANTHGVGFLPGTYFSSRKQLKNYLRLSFAHYNVANLKKGAKRLAAAIK